MGFQRDANARNRSPMSLFSRLFTWWNGATALTRWDLARTAREVGRDAAGNIYYASKRGDRRSVIYNGVADASRIDADWHLWMHGANMPPPSVRDVEPPRWVKPHVANLTGSAAAHVPSGSLRASGKRARATGDYEAWSPD